MRETVRDSLIRRINTFLACLACSFLSWRSLRILLFPQYTGLAAAPDWTRLGFDLVGVLLTALLLNKFYLVRGRRANDLGLALAVFFGANLLGLTRSTSGSVIDRLFAVFCLLILLAYALWLQADNKDHGQVGWTLGSLGLCSGPGLEKEQFRLKFAGLLLGLALVVNLLAGLVYAYYRMKLFHSPSFDYGIFVQAMEGIIATGRPITSLERGYEITHSAVHFSPALYFFVPLYYLFRSHEFLNYAQVIVVLLALLPAGLWFRNLGLNRTKRIVLLALLAASPFQIFSSYYDFHENCLLTLTIFTYLWLRSDQRFSWIGWRVLAGLGILMVKEDAFIYLFAISAYYLVANWRKGAYQEIWRDAVMLVVSLLYFVLAVSYIRSFGLGIMTSRFSNLYIDFKPSLVDVLKVIYLYPDLVLSRILVWDKATYLLLSLLSSAGVLFWTRQRELWLLALPLCLVNLVSDWPYQTSLFHQYHYGSQALLLVALAVTWAELDKKAERGLGQGSVVARNKFRPVLEGVLHLALVSSLVISFSLAYLKIKPLYLNYQENKERMEILEQAVTSLPEEASVYGTSFLCSRLALKHRNLYSLNYFRPENAEQIEYIILDLRFSDSTDKSLPPELAIQDFQCLELQESLYAIYRRR